MDKPKNGTGKSQSWQDRNLYFSDVLGARGAVSVLLDAFNLRKSYGSYNAEHIPKLFTLSPTLQNYADAFTSVPLGKYLLNTLIFTVVTTALMMVVITLAAYAFARLSFPGKNLVFTFFCP